MHLLPRQQGGCTHALVIPLPIPDSSVIFHYKMSESRPKNILTPVGEVPSVSTQMKFSDHLGAFKVRWGVGRMKYTVNPGLYAVGEPGRQSEVLVTANYRMTFDLVRSSLSGVDAWLLVLDTGGVNVWCAAGKGTFGTRELVSRITASNLTRVVDHRRLIVPQLGAVGVAAHRVKEESGFTVLYGPVEARDIKEYLARGLRASPAMRRKVFPVRARAALIPMELVPALKYAAVIAAAMALFSGLFGPGSILSDILFFGKASAISLLAAVIAGAVLVPLLLPWLPGKAFSLKGFWIGLGAALGVFFFILRVTGNTLSAAAWVLLVPALTSFLAMNFTGSSTYTSLSGVRREMRIAVPLQAAGSILGAALWLGSLFVNRGGAA